MQGVPRLQRITGVPIKVTKVMEAAGETEILENNRCANKGYKG
jgi:hypothetical protein